MIHGVEFAQRRFDIAVVAEGAVEHAAAGRARAEIFHRLLAGGDDIIVEGHAHVVVGAEQDRVAPVADRARRREHLLHDEVERILHPGGEKRLAGLDDRVELGQQIDGFCSGLSGHGVGHACGLYQLSCSLWTATTS